MADSKAPPPGQASIIEAVRALLEAGERASADAVARRLGITRQAASRQLHALERKGLLRDRPKLVRSGHWELT